MNLVQIARSWYALKAAAPSTVALMTQRLAICDPCPAKIQMNTIGELLVTKVNEEASIYRCSECGCPLAAKTALPENECPLKKWLSTGDQSYF